MRILWMSHVVPYPPKAGVLLRAHYLLRSLADAHDVDLVAFIQEPLLQTFYEDLSTGLTECRRALEESCRSVLLLPIDRARRRHGQIRTAIECLAAPGGYVGSWLYSATARDEIRRHVAPVRYDAAHFDSISVARYRPEVREASALLGHHNAESHMLSRRADNQTGIVSRMYFAREARRLAQFERAVAPSFAEHITCSDLDAERLRETMPCARMSTVPNGVDIDYFQPIGLDERPNSLIFVGTMNWYPNVQAVMFLLTEIWPILRGLVPTVTLDIIGAGAPKQLLDVAKSCQGVAVHGYVDDIRPLMDSASVFVCPIRDGGGTKLKILDAFAMAKCVVAHPVACEGIRVTAQANVSLAASAAEFVVSIRDLLAERSKRRSMGEAARRLVEAEYSFASIGRAFVGIVERVAERDTGAAG
jgi:polysaccharide biosynthesis protein PslH